MEKVFPVLMIITVLFCFSACSNSSATISGGQTSGSSAVVPQTGIDYESHNNEESTTESTANTENVLQDNSDTVTEQKIRISVGGQSFTAILADTKAA